MKYNYLYKITNMINNKIYIGIHYGELDDSYLGSGKLIKQAIKKYRTTNFKKEILVIGETKEYVADIEFKIVNDIFITRNDTYNITVGGGNPPTIVSDETRKKMSISHTGKTSGMKGKHMSLESREKMSKSKIGSKHHRSIQVGQYDVKTNMLIKVYDCMSSAELDGFSKQCIYCCCKGKTKTHKGFIWKYYK